MQRPKEFAGALSWDDVRVFRALMQDRSFKVAGARLGVAGSTVGRRLDALERALGARLFDRTPDGVLPTAAAEQLVVYAEQMEQAAGALVSAVEGFETVPEGVVRLTAPPGIVDHFVAPRLPALYARYPKLVLELHASVGYADLTRREADLALRASRPTAGDLLATRLAEEEDVLFASPSYVQELGTLQGLAQARWITWGADLAQIPPARWVSTAVPASSIILRTSSLGAQVAAAEAGAGVLLLPRAYARVTRLEEVRLAPKLRESLPPRPVQALWLVGHRALRAVPRVAAVWTFLLEAFGSE